MGVLHIRWNLISRMRRFSVSIIKIILSKFVFVEGVNSFGRATHKMNTTKIGHERNKRNLFYVQLHPFLNFVFILKGPINMDKIQSLTFFQNISILQYSFKTFGTSKNIYE